ncbi:MAG: VOC family protein [Cyclobacteriaceae bacterium]
MVQKKNCQINYVELKANNLELIKEFCSNAFDWAFTDYGPNYVAFYNSGLEGGFEKTNREIVNGALIVLYHEDLRQIKDKIVDVGVRIIKNTFSFPGGRRFHFTDPSNNELAVWCDQ